jgi:hypothetical protein
MVMRILELTDSLNIHRESVIIHLAMEGKGSITLLSDGHLRIVCPSSVTFDEWLIDLRSKLEMMDLSRVSRH